MLILPSPHRPSPIFPFARNGSFLRPKMSPSHAAPRRNQSNGSGFKPDETRDKRLICAMPKPNCRTRKVQLSRFPPRGQLNFSTAPD